jgi:hypothetical protein
MQCLLCSARGGEVAILAIRGKGVLEEKGAECCQRSLESWGYNDGNRVVTEFWMEGEGRKRLRGEVRIPSPVHRPTPPHLPGSRPPHFNYMPAVTPTGTQHGSPVTLYSPLGTARRRPLLAEGVALSEEASQPRLAAVEGFVEVYVLHRVLYPQVHVNGCKKKSVLALRL